MNETSITGEKFKQQQQQQNTPEVRQQIFSAQLK